MLTAVLGILLLLSFLPLMRVTVNVLYENGLRVEIRFALFSIKLWNFGKSSDKKSSRIPFRSIVRRCSEAIGSAEVTVRKLEIPYGVAKDELFGYALPVGYGIAAGALLGYLESNAGLLHISDNALIRASDSGGGAAIDVSFKTRSYVLLAAVFGMLADRSRQKRKDRKNVGN